MKVKCTKCGYEWETKSKHMHVTCPSCLGKVNLKPSRKFELGVCEKCKKHFQKLHIHHIIPISKGGDNEQNNLIQLCSSCHMKTHNIKEDNPKKKSYEDLLP